jgi:hypothetical protein
VPLPVEEFNDLFTQALRSLRRLEPTWLRHFLDRTRA